MTKEDILGYVAKTPHNTNPNMIGNMIDTLTAQSGGGLPDSSEASVGDVLTKGEDGIGWATPSGGEQLYTHQLRLEQNYTGLSMRVNLTLINTTSTAITSSNFASVLAAIGSSPLTIPCTGYIAETTGAAKFYVLTRAVFTIANNSIDGVMYYGMRFIPSTSEIGADKYYSDFQGPTTVVDFVQPA